MNILVKDSTGEIKDYNKDFVLFNNAVVASDSGNVLYIYSDLNTSNASVHDIQEAIVDFDGNKYLYQAGVVIENPNYTAPQEV